MDYSQDIAVVRFQACVHSLFGILFPDLTHALFPYNRRELDIHCQFHSCKIHCGAADQQRIQADDTTCATSSEQPFVHTVVQAPLYATSIRPSRSVEPSTRRVGIISSE